MQQINAPTIEEIRTAVGIEFSQQLTNFFSKFNLQPRDGTDDIGRGAKFASKITGKAVTTIYDLVQQDLIPHSKQGKDLYFSRSELLLWIKSGKRNPQTGTAGEDSPQSDLKQTR